MLHCCWEGLQRHENGANLDVHAPYTSLAPKQRQGKKWEVQQQSPYRSREGRPSFSLLFVRVLALGMCKAHELASPKNASTWELSSQGNGYLTHVADRSLRKHPTFSNRPTCCLCQRCQWTNRVSMQTPREKYHQHKLQWVKTILGTRRSRVQEPITGSTRTSSSLGSCPCASCK